MLPSVGTNSTIPIKAENQELRLQHTDIIPGKENYTQFDDK